MRKLRRMSCYMENKYSRFEAVDKEYVEAQLEEVVDDIFDKLPDASAVKAPKPKVESYEYHNVNEGLINLIFGDKVPSADTIDKFVKSSSQKIISWIIAKLTELQTGIQKLSEKNDSESNPPNADKLAKVWSLRLDKNTLRLNGKVDWIDDNIWVKKFKGKMNANCVIAVTKDQKVVCDINGVATADKEGKKKRAEFSQRKSFNSLSDVRGIFQFIQNTCTSRDIYAKLA